MDCLICLEGKVDYDKKIKYAFFLFLFKELEGLIEIPVAQIFTNVLLDLLAIGFCLHIFADFEIFLLNSFKFQNY